MPGTALAARSALGEPVCELLWVAATMDLDEPATPRGGQPTELDDVIIGVEVRLEQERDTDAELALGRPASEDVVERLLDLVLGQVRELEAGREFLRERRFAGRGRAGDEDDDAVRNFAVSGHLDGRTRHR